MHNGLLVKLLMKFKKEELVDVLVQRGYVNERFRDEISGSKSSIVSQVLKVCGRKFTEREVAIVDLIFHQTHAKTKKWEVYHLAGYDPINSSVTALSDPVVLEKKLQAQLKLYFKVGVCVQQWKNALWIRLAIFGKKTPSSSVPACDIVYLVYHPHSPYLITTNIKAAHKEFIFQVFADVLGCDVVQRMNLSGKDVPSLADMVLNSHSQGFFSHYRLGMIDADPLAICCRKRGHDEDDTDNIQNTEDLVNENNSNDQNRLLKINKTFGSNRQPVLEKAEFLMHTRFRATQYVPLQKKPFRCSVKFEGPSVIEGIKNLGVLGVASLPLPSHLANLHSYSRSQFLLTDRKRTKIADIEKEDQKLQAINSSINHN